MPPNIPTSFVPHEAARHQGGGSFASAYGYFAYFVFGIILAGAFGVFFYDRILAGTEAAREATLQQAEKDIDPATVEGFVRLRNRLDESQALLNEHIEFSNFFASLAELLPINVRFTALHLSTDMAGGAKVDGAGVAKNFNALSAASGAFASESHIKDVIFSRITINRDSSVSFGFSASIDPKLLAFTPGAPSIAAPAPAPAPAPASAATTTIAL